MSESEFFVCKRCGGGEHEAISQEIASYSCPLDRLNKIKPLDTIELWKEVKEYEGLYLISDMGNIKSLRLNRNLKLTKTNRGYLTIGLYSSKRRSKNFLVHRLVTNTFIGAVEGKEVNHKNGNKSDNRAVNLELCTRQENVNHAKKMGLIPRGIKHRNSKNNPELVKKILQAGYRNLPMEEIKLKYNVSLSFIQEVLHGVHSSEALTQEIASYSCPNVLKSKSKLKMLDSVSLKYLTKIDDSSETQDLKHTKSVDNGES